MLAPGLGLQGLGFVIARPRLLRHGVKTGMFGKASAVFAGPEPQAGGQFSAGLLLLPLNMTKHLGLNSVR